MKNIPTTVSLPPDVQEFAVWDTERQGRPLSNYITEMLRKKMNAAKKRMTAAENRKQKK